MQLYGGEAGRTTALNPLDRYMEVLMLGHSAAVIEESANLYSHTAATHKHRRRMPPFADLMTCVRFASIRRLAWLESLACLGVQNLNIESRLGAEGFVVPIV